ncbi:uncharacterized protein G2W53_007609 [Senna tora]|uniref:Uncharacterized protein n=1 Tax=Senna tora TaxID=362788 RepID=A0A834X7A4_9FABA|nr:uncharacterized protein G2W53_007609 [Senna tora]
MTYSFHVITSPIGALSPLGFPNTTRSDRFDLYFLNYFEIQSRFLVQNVFRHDFTLLPYDYKPHWSIKYTRIPKYNAKRSTSLHTLSMRSRVHSSIKSTRIPKYNVKRSIKSRFWVQNVFTHDFTLFPCDRKSHSSIKSTQIPKYNEKRSV